MRHGRLRTAQGGVRLESAPPACKPGAVLPNTPSPVPRVKPGPPRARAEPVTRWRSDGAARGHRFARSKPTEPPRAQRTFRARDASRRSNPSGLNGVPHPTSCIRTGSPRRHRRQARSRLRAPPLCSPCTEWQPARPSDGDRRMASTRAATGEDSPAADSPPIRSRGRQQQPRPRSAAAQTSAPTQAKHRQCRKCLPRAKTQGRKKGRRGIPLAGTRRQPDSN